jgi:hypothetical protein
MPGRLLRREADADTEAAAVSGSFVLHARPITDPQQRAISCNGCGAILSSTRPLDPDEKLSIKVAAPCRSAAQWSPFR